MPISSYQVKLACQSMVRPNDETAFREHDALNAVDSYSAQIGWHQKMKRKHTFAVVLLLGVLGVGGCLTKPAGEKLTRVSVGMTKDEVVKVMGTPSSIAATGHVQILKYEVPSMFSSRAMWSSDWTPYYVRLVDGKVESYGRLGDFDSTKDPTLNINIKNK